MKVSVFKCQVSGRMKVSVFRCQNGWKSQILGGKAVTAKSYMDVEDLDVYKKRNLLYMAQMMNRSHMAGQWLWSKFYS